MKVLVVDDSVIARAVVSRLVLEAKPQAEILEAEDGEEALERILGAVPDLVLCDVNMPKRDGLEVLAELRRRGIPVPFGLVTSDPGVEVAEAAMSASAFVLQKPFEPADLLRHIAAVGGPS